jgi:hypothetical protein
MGLFASRNKQEGVYMQQTLIVYRYENSSRYILHYLSLYAQYSVIYLSTLFYFLEIAQLCIVK